MPPSWGKITDNIGATTPSTTPGTTVTAGASNADGTEVSLLSALGHDAEFVAIGIAGFFTSNNTRATLLDILIDPAGGTTWSVLIDNLLCGQTNATSVTANVPLWYYFPLWIPAGASIGARARNNTASTIAGKVIISVMGANARPGTIWCGRKVETIGVTESTSTGTSHTPGTSPTYSSWSNVGSTMSAPCGAVQYGVQREANGTTAISYWFEFGVASTRIGSPVYRNNATTEMGGMMSTGVIYCSLPTGTQWQVRGVTATGSPQAHGVAIYAVQ